MLHCKMSIFTNVIHFSCATGSDASSWQVLVQMNQVTCVFVIPEVNVVFAGTPSSDYEIWSPSDAHLNGSCLLGKNCPFVFNLSFLAGRTVAYIRRKQNAICYDDLPYELRLVSKNCPCTAVDFEWYVAFLCLLCTNELTATMDTCEAWKVENVRFPQVNKYVVAMFLEDTVWLPMTPA